VCHRDHAGGPPINHWRSASGYEVDFVLGDHTAIEVKAKENVAPRDGLRRSATARRSVEPHARLGRMTSARPSPGRAGRDPLDHLFAHTLLGVEAPVARLTVIFFSGSQGSAATVVADGSVPDRRFLDPVGFADVEGREPPRADPGEGLRVAAVVVADHDYYVESVFFEHLEYCVLAVLGG
jgi:hypothetical protein